MNAQNTAPITVVGGGVVYHYVGGSLEILIYCLIGLIILFVSVKTMKWLFPKEEESEEKEKKDKTEKKDKKEEKPQNGKQTKTQPKPQDEE